MSQKLTDRKHVIFSGDFNFGDGEVPETKHLPSEYIDAWKATSKNAKGFTWNIEKSTMAREGSFPGEKSRRLDRILIRSSSFAPVSAAIVGNRPVKKNFELFPSDHFGIIADLRITKEK